MSNDPSGLPKTFKGTAIMPAISAPPSAAQPPVDPSAHQQPPYPPQPYGPPPGLAYGPQPGYGPPPGFGPQPGYEAQAQAGYAPQAPPGYAPQGGYGAPGYAAPAPPSQAHAHAHAGGDVLPCPECGQNSNSIKRYTYLNWCAFLWFFAYWQRKTMVACPSCMRKELGIRTAINIVLANILWPFIILPWNGILFCMTFSEGHSSSVKAMLGQQR
jgi:hypothetical protein